MMSCHEPQYVIVTENEDGTTATMELPAEMDGTLLLSTVTAQFPGAIGLKYPNPARTSWRGIRLADGVLHPPTADGWTETTYVITVRPDSAKRKMAESTTQEPSTKRSAAESNSSDPKHSDLIVLGLAFTATESEVRTYFEQYGEIAMIEIKKDPVTEKSKGFGFIRFTDSANCKTVLNKMHTIAGRRCEVKRPYGKETPNKIFVGRLPKEATDMEVRSLFEKYGEVTDVYIPRPHRGFCFVSFQDPECTQTVLNMSQDITIRDAVLNITTADPKTGGNRFEGGMGRGGMMGGRGGGGGGRGFNQGGRGGGDQYRGNQGAFNQGWTQNNQNSQQMGPFDFEDMKNKMQQFAAFMNTAAMHNPNSPMQNQAKQEWSTGQNNPTDYTNYYNYK